MEISTLIAQISTIILKFFKLHKQRKGLTLKILRRNGSRNKTSRSEIFKTNSELVILFLFPWIRIISKNTKYVTLKTSWEK